MRYSQALICFLFAQFSLALSPVPPAVVVQKDIVYGQGDTQSGPKDLLLDLYTPGVDDPSEPIAKRPAVILIHGGSFQTGSKENAALVNMANDLVLRGYVAAVINYRLQGDEPIPSNRVSHLPTQSGVAAPLAQQIAAQAALDDAITAFEWLISREDRYQISDIGLIGSSAGAITAINLAYISDDFSIDLPNRDRISFVVNYWGGALLPLDNPNEAVKSVDQGEAPIFIVHGSNDIIVSFNYSVLLDQRAEEVGLDYQYHVIDGGGHGFAAIDPFNVTVESGKSIANAMYEWIDNISQHSFGQQSVGSWYEPATSGQGLLLDLDDRSKQVFGAWFTYNNEAGSENGQIPGAEQRWFTAQGKYSGRRAVLDLFQSRNGRFDANNTVETSKVGTLELNLESCKKGTARYDMPALGLNGDISIVRLMSNSNCP
ncbi:alpha/beta hydrolase [Pseudoteredinibacter isoporae]|uniref:Acetyl esterase/lipase n=1 Tax=Pseudoteredinibacter isoporae TaxID=570281 RepID=A0A7X0JS10_9GAMM|nr:alpha/beta hydrolase [Pseudoteredinibacter isoporae]MBB6520286.1 acetyl esterase/lipase [Pseudoteredinibacter isoporae]NHO85857.1 alpha/beta hydrolase [Pseudoteredinibacter isoporae]NIB25691.1 alpha/beta hydrolase [Pseudoteredinibacter isoporae]